MSKAACCLRCALYTTPESLYYSKVIYVPGFLHSLENAPDLTVSRLRKYLELLGVRLQILAVFENDGDGHCIPIRLGRS